MDEKILNLSEKLWRPLNYIAGVFMTAEAVLLVLNIVLRKFFNAPIYGTTEIVQYMGLVIAALALADNEWADGNITLTILIDLIKDKKRFYKLKAAVHLIEAGVFVLLDYLLVLNTIDKYVMGNATSELRFPKWIPSAVLTFGMIVLTIALVLKAIVYLITLKKNKEINFVTRNAIDDND